MRYLLFLIFLFSCTSASLKDDQEPAVRMTESGDNKKPSFYLQDFDNKVGRFLASSVDDDSLSNKQLYFLSLYEQTHQLKSMLGDNNVIQICPGFHNEVLTYSSTMDLNGQGLAFNRNYKIVLNKPDKLPGYPVMALQYDDSDVYHYLKENPDSNINEIVESAIKKYVQGLEEELVSLCSMGVSDDYFIFENYVSYARQDSDMTGPRQILTAAFKIPVFANLLLLESFKTNTFLSNNLITDVALERTSLVWLKNYLYELEKVRNHDTEYSLLMIDK